MSAPMRSIGPYLLKHYTMKRGYTGQVIEFCQEFTSAQLVKLFAKFATKDTLALCISSTFWMDQDKIFFEYDGGMPPNIYHAVKYIKEKYPHVKIVVGGAHCTYLRRRIEDVDVLFIGESEDTLPDLLDHWTKGTPSPVKEINPITKKTCYRFPVNKTYDIATCDFEWTERDCVMPGEVLPLETARGCIFKCKFCAYPHLGKKKFDYLKPDANIHQQLTNNYERWKVDSYIMLDDTFNDSEYKIDNFLAMSKSLPFQLEYTAFIRADLVHRFAGMAEKLLESGLRGGFFGIESLHPQASVIVGKGWSGKEARAYIPHLLHNVWQDRVNIQVGLIAGLPGETREHLWETLKWVNDNQLRANFSALNVTSNLHERHYISEFERNAASYGFKFDKNGLWYNDDWTRASVIEFSNEINNARLIKSVPTGLDGIALKSFGYTMDEIYNGSWSKFHRKSPEFRERLGKFLSLYWQKINDLPVI